MWRHLVGGFALSASLLLATSGLDAPRRRAVALHTLLTVFMALSLAPRRRRENPAEDGGPQTQPFWADLLTGEHRAIEAEELFKRRRQLLRICRRETEGRPRLQPLALQSVPGSGPSAGPGAPNRLNIASWNMLSQEYALGSGFGLAAPETLDWNFRRWRLLEALASLFFNEGGRGQPPGAENGADVLCLQEVDKFSWFSQMLGYIGYEGVFSILPGGPRSDGTAAPAPPPDHGVAVFYHTEKFELLDVFRTGGKQTADPAGDGYRGCFARLRRRDAGDALRPKVYALEVQQPHAADFGQEGISIHLRTYRLPEDFLLNRVPFYIVETPPGGLALGHEPEIVGKVVFKDCIEYESYVHYAQDVARHGRPVNQPRQLWPEQPGHGPQRSTELDLYSLLASMSARSGSGQTFTPSSTPVAPSGSDGGGAVSWAGERPTFGWVIDHAEYYPPGDPKRTMLPISRLSRRYRSIYEIQEATELIVANCHFSSAKSEAGRERRHRQAARLYRDLVAFVSRSTSKARLPALMGSPRHPPVSPHSPMPQSEHGLLSTPGTREPRETPAIRAHPFLEYYSLANEAAAQNAQRTPRNDSSPNQGPPRSEQRPRSWSQVGGEPHSLAMGFGLAEIVLAGDLSAEADEASVQMVSTLSGMQEAYGVLEKAAAERQAAAAAELAGEPAPKSGTPAATSYKLRTGVYNRGIHRCWIDYLFHSERLRPRELLLLPKEAMADARGQGSSCTLASLRDNAAERACVHEEMQKLIKLRQEIGELSDEDEAILTHLRANDSLPALSWPSDHWCIATSFEYSVI